MSKQTLWKPHGLWAFKDMKRYKSELFFSLHTSCLQLSIQKRNKEINMSEHGFLLRELHFQIGYFSNNIF